MVTFKTKGDFRNSESFFKRVLNIDFASKLKPYAEAGVQALAEHTPVESGKTAASWGYTITRTRNQVKIIWTNSNVVGNTPLAVMIQYGHGTGGGGYVQGIDYINPALKPIFRQIADEVWREVTGG